MAKPKIERPLTPKDLLALLQSSEERERLLRYENSLLRQRLLLHEPDDVVRRLVHEPSAEDPRGKLVLIADERVTYRANLTPDTPVR